MTYYLAKTLDRPFDEVAANVQSALEAQGFGVLTDIDVTAVLKKKLDADFRRYRILGACNPKFALDALQAEDKIGTMLPCNVIVQELADGQVEIAAVDPVASMQAIHNPKLAALASSVRDLLEKAVDAV